MEPYEYLTNSVEWLHAQPVGIQVAIVFGLAALAVLSVVLAFYIVKYTILLVYYIFKGLFLLFAAIIKGIVSLFKNDQKSGQRGASSQKSALPQYCAGCGRPIAYETQNQIATGHPVYCAYCGARQDVGQSQEVVQVVLAPSH